MIDGNGLPTNVAWAMRGVYIFSIILAFIADVALVDQIKKIRSYLRKLERWIKKLPIKAVMRWHIKYVSERLETSLWRKHPDWICFIVGYLLTAVLCAHSILAYLPEMAKHPPKGFLIEALPRSPLISPMPADVLGGLMLMLIRRLLKWGAKAKLIYLYMAIIVFKASVGISLFLMMTLGFLKGIAEYIYIYHPAPKSINAEIEAYYWKSEFMGGIIFWCACIANVIWLMDWILYCFEFSLLLWLLSHLAIWITKAIRLLLQKADGMYCFGAVCSISTFAELMMQAYPYIAAIPAGAWLWLKFFFGLGH